MKTVGISTKRLLSITFVLVFLGAWVSPGAFAQTPSLEELAAQVEILRSRLEETTAVTVPVGGVVAWSGDPAGIPENFELCDGTLPTTPGAVYTGNKPDLVERFVRGAGATAGSTGGLDTIPVRRTSTDPLTINQLPAHTHGFTDAGHIHDATDTGHDHLIRELQHTWYSTQKTVLDPVSYDLVHSTLSAPYFDFPYFPPQPRVRTDLGNANVEISSATTNISINPTGGDEGHDHQIDAHDNRPAYYELFYIIRVK